MENKNIEIEINENSLSPINHLPKKNTKWADYHEKIFIDWCDKAMSYRYLHTNCQRYYYKLKVWFTIPVIFISTLTGVANFAQERIPETYQFYYTIGIGSFNIIAGFITTVSQFLKVGELYEAHRVSSISWGKFCRNINIELAKCREERIPINLYLKSVKEEYDLLLETSPSITKKEINLFKKKFKKANFIKPEICDNLVSVAENMYIEPQQPIDDDIQTVQNIKKKRESIMYDIQIENFVKDYKAQNKTEPSIEEIYENLEDSINKIYIDKFVERLHNKIEKTN